MLALSLVSQKLEKKPQVFVCTVTRRARSTSDSQIAHNSSRSYPLWRYPLPLLVFVFPPALARPPPENLNVAYSTNSRISWSLLSGGVVMF